MHSPAVPEQLCKGFWVVLSYAEQSCTVLVGLYGAALSCSVLCWPVMACAVLAVRC